eukprot:364837-Chlamydomonas_euryale.AAC.4
MTGMSSRPGYSGTFGGGAREVGQRGGSRDCCAGDRRAHGEVWVAAVSPHVRGTERMPRANSESEPTQNAVPDWRRQIRFLTDVDSGKVPARRVPRACPRNPR